MRNGQRTPKRKPKQAKVRIKKTNVAKSKPAGNKSLKPKKKITLKKVLACFIVLIFVGIIGGVSVGIVWMAQAPPLDTNKFNFTNTTHLVDKNGKYYQELQGSENRNPVSIDEIPEIVQLAFISIEDKRFYDHGGVDIIGTGKAIMNVFLSGSTDGPGGSTITQQLIKLTHLTSENSIKRKVMEWRLAVEAESKLSKEQILEAYLNKVNMSQAWGIQAGAEFFFGKKVNKLSVAQSAVLASIINAPSYYNPLVYKETGDGEYKLVRKKNGDGKKVLAYDENNRDRALLVVENMHNQGHINDAEYEIAKADLEKNRIGLVEPKDNSIYSYFTDAVYTQVIDDIKEKYNYSEDDASTFLLNSGLTIKSTVDPKIQNVMDKVSTHDYLFPSQSYSAAAASEAMTRKTGEEVNYIPQVGMAIVENKTGNVVGILGGRGKKSGSLSMNRAMQKFQPGSSTKPLTTYGPGVDSGKITMASAYNDSKISIGSWSPSNSGGGHQGMMTCRAGLTQSVNTIAVQALMETTPEVVQPYAKKLGLEIVTEGDHTDLNPAALALGGYSYGQSPLNMASAYSTFPNQGVRNDAVLYTEVVDSNGEVILNNTKEKRRVFQKGTAFIITDVLKNVVKGGTTSRSVPGAEIAGKTGTTDENMHAWFCGYTNEYSGAVWYGYDENKVEVDGSTYHLNIGTFGGSSNGPAAFWEEVFRGIYEKKKIKNSSFAKRPDDVVSMSVDGASGKRPGSLSSKDPMGKKVYTEYFLRKFVPSGSDDLHVAKTVCTASNKTATKYCPKSMVEKKVMYNISKIHYPPGVSGPSGGGALAKYAYKGGKKGAGTCDIHNANTPTSMAFYQGGKRVSSVTLNSGESTTLTVKGSSEGGGVSLRGVKFSASGNIRISPSGNSVTVTAAGGGGGTVYASCSPGKGLDRLSASCSVSVKGSTATPTITLSGVSGGSITVPAGTNPLNQIGVSASDPNDGDLTDQVQVSVSGGNGWYNTPGTYTITYTVTNSGGVTATQTVTVTITDTGGGDDGDDGD